MSKQTRMRSSKKLVRSLSRSSQCACQALEQRTLLSAVVAPHFGVETFLQDNHVRLIDPGIVLIFWGSYWGGTNTPQAQTIQTAVNNACSSGYFSATAEYGTGGDPFLSSASAYLSTNPVAGFSQANVDGAVDQAIASGQIGSYTFNRTIYEVVTPPGINSGLAGGPSGFNRETASGHVDAWCSTGGTGTNTIAVDGYSLNMCHETAEGMTDPGGQGIKFTPPASWANGGSGNQIGDYEGNYYSFREVDGALVQPLWSAANQAWLAGDSKTQNLNLSGNWSGNSFFGSYTLTVNGDQLGSNFADTVTLDTSNGGAQVVLNGETTNFDPNRITGITVNTGGGNNTVNVYQTLAGAPVSIYGGGADIVNIGGSYLQNIFGSVYVQNSPNYTTLNIDDSADGVARTATLGSTGLTGLTGAAGGVITWAQSDLNALNIVGGPAGNTFTVTGTPQNPHGVVTSLSSGQASDIVNVRATNGSLTINGQGGSDTLTVDDSGFSVPYTYAIDYGSLSRSGLSVAYNGVENVAVYAGNAVDTLNITNMPSQSLAINAGGGDDVVNFGTGNGVNLSTATALVTLNGGGGSNTLNVDDHLIPAGFGTDYSITATSVTLTPQYVGGTPESFTYGNFATLSINPSVDNHTINVASTTAATAYVFNTTGAETNTVNLGSGDISSIVSDTVLNRGGITCNTNFFGGGNVLNINDQNSLTPRSYTFNRAGLTGGSVLIAGQLNVGLAGLQYCTLNAGNAADNVNVLGMNLGTINGGGGNDSFTVAGANVSNVTVNGNAGVDTMAMSTAHVIGPGTYRITSTSVDNLYQGTVELSVHYSTLEGITYSTVASAGNTQVQSTAYGTPLIINPGAGDSVTLGGAGFPLNGIVSPVTINGLGGTGSTANNLTLDGSSGATPAIVHINPTQIGATAGDTLFGAGGTLTFGGIAAVSLNTPNASPGDTIYARPSATTAMTINGGNPTTLPGDTLTLADADATTPHLTPNGTGAGQYTFGNRMPVTFTGIEQAVINNTAPAVTNASFQYNVFPQSLTATFSEDVSPSLSATPVSILNQTTGGSPVSYTVLPYDHIGNTVTLRFGPAILPDGDYHLTLPAGTIADSAGNPLAADFTFDFFALAGDANHDHNVDTIDFNILAANFGQSGKTFSQGDFNYDTVVDTVDFNLLAANFAKTLAGGGVGAASIPTPDPLHAAKTASPFGQVPIDDSIASILKDVAPVL